MTEKNETVDRRREKVLALALPPRERTLWREHLPSSSTLTADLILQIRRPPQPPPGPFLQTEAMRACTELFQTLPLDVRLQVLAAIPLRHTEHEVDRYLEEKLRKELFAKLSSATTEPDIARRRAIVKRNPDLPYGRLCLLFDAEKIPLTRKMKEAGTWAEAHKSTDHRHKVESLITSDRKIVGG